MMSVRLAIAAAIAVSVIAGVVMFAAAGGSRETDAPAASTSTATTMISRRDLVEIDTADGTLGYADTRIVANRLRGTVTWLPPAGRVVRADRTLYRVNDVPVILMNGRVPAYRALGPGTSDGNDVRQLERSLRSGGYDPGRAITIDGSWDAGTTAAVRRWQAAHSVTESGTIEPGRIVFLPGTRRVASADSRAPQRVVLTTTSTRRQVKVALETSKSALAQKSALVRIELPSGATVRGRIQSVGKVATAAPKEQGAPPTSDQTATIEVKIRLFSRKAALDQAPVTVRFEKSRRKDVLAIPVTALLVRSAGEYAVQLVQADGTRRVVAVQPGLYTSGYVQIAGSGLRPGQRVTNAAVK